MAIDIQETQNSLFGNIPKTARIEALNPEFEQQADTPVEQEAEQEEAKSKAQAHQSYSAETRPDERQESVPTGPKYSELDKATVLLYPDQKESLERWARRLMKHRSKAMKGESKERLTSNSFIRSLIDLALERESKLDLAFIHDENDLQAWLSQLFRD